MSKAGIAMKLRGTALEPSTPQPGHAVALEKPEPAAPAPTPSPPAVLQIPDADTDDGLGSSEAFVAAYRSRLREALAQLPGGADEFTS